jgi:hypothetical protein
LEDLYQLPAQDVTYVVVRDFVLMAEETNGLTESMTVELKAARSGRKVIDAVQGFANADGGLVLVGVSEEHHGEARFVGVTRREHDAIVSQLRGSVGSAMPEVIPIALPDNPDKLIVLLRVNADATPTPLVVGGRVMIRLPGQTAPARREDIISLVRRGEGGTATRTWSAQPPMVDPGNIPLWNRDEGPHLTIRIHGGLLLPSRVLARPRLSTAAHEAAVVALTEGPLPGGIWSSADRRPEPDAMADRWVITESTSTRLRITARHDQGSHRAVRPQVAASIYLTIAGRLLQGLVGIGVDPSMARPGYVPELSVAELREALFAALVALYDTSHAIATAVDADNPSSPFDAQAWLQPREQMPLTPMLDLNEWTLIGNRHLPGASFGPTPISATTRSTLDAVVMEWLATLLLDHGATAFEQELQECKRAAWMELSGL